MSENVRLYRPNRFPILGKQESLNVFSDATDYVILEPAQPGISDAGDLGYVYGTMKHMARHSKTETGLSSYLHIWKKESDVWKMVLEVTNPIKTDN